MKFTSQFVSRDGRFVALNGTYANAGKDGNLASVPIVIILEVRDGRIVREDQYYDNGAFY
jgi:ketosteroid isomerase-like protein